MYKSISFLIGGVQGEGVISSGVSLMKALSSLGYYTYEKRNFSSRIKGGNNTITLHVGVEKKMWVQDQIDFMVALDEETLHKYTPLVKEGQPIFYDSVINTNFGVSNREKLIPLPITEIAKSSGAIHMKNTSTIGFIGHLLGITEEKLIETIQNRFKYKDQEIIDKNINVLKNVIRYVDTDFFASYQSRLAPTQEISRPLMMGNDAISLGAVAAGCRFVASYPITPASEVMENLGKLLPKYDGIMVQVEDEIAAINMIIGSSYGGVRSLTATSGPGISLMMEGIGLAGMTETPIVIVNSSRVGPSTGLPTKHEQSDLIGLYYGGHGEYPSIILSPSTVEDCFYTTLRSFNLSEKYQCPVIILSDLSLSLSHQTIDGLDYSNIEINRGKLYEPLVDKEYKRYELTEDHISPRAFPGTPGGIHHTTGLEHQELGLPTDLPLNRKKMMEKRLQKISSLELGEEIILNENGSNVLFLAFGSTYGVVRGAMEAIETPLDYGYIRMIKPLPTHQLKKLLQDYDHVVVVENNYSKQLATIIKGEIGFHEKIHSLTKYDGTPFTLGEIITEIGRWV